MPELPEVEVVRRRLLTCLPGLVVRDVRVHDATVCDLPEDELRRTIAGRRVLGLRRRGKYLMIDLGAVEVQGKGRDESMAEGKGRNESVVQRKGRDESRAAGPPAAAGRLLVVHLRMTGQLLFRPEPRERQARFVITFDPSTELHFYDLRRFGRLWSLDPADEEAFFAALGPEPFSPDFDVGYLRRALAGRRAPVKAFLLDQRRIAGVGNIYADEALFRAGLNPLRAAGSVGPREAQRLHAALLETLQAGIDHEGSSIESFIDPAGRRGGFQEILNVYQRTGEPCRVCGTAIERVVVGGRGTHYCPRCQPRRGGIAPTARRARPTGPAGKRDARGAPPATRGAECG
ncbi:MAG TPA: bifunctional DNA-formamidopyrimidine glycosylase/DNA-(apurinic or apyrimidinic site) lyase [Thermoleophilia bacterium]|mgnify:CR=1 FL=1|nr:bifunctional DNA-formamidopyrimidine glycosylase/DNA-(apurinic or apyrimidinic site) lyase [Thermoleophilia bacterium]